MISCKRIPSPWHMHVCIVWLSTCATEPTALLNYYFLKTSNYIKFVYN
ncbi:hypothetical protein [Plasmodium yoelii yoelii]|uniref:Uncharacterized protein n=1 Tax=Plasmodium yoelii yoelii TaxID=73239 RepID=Q7RJ21_PLAYO|nr:hypothetical protein [Plasmodium yoelii yoelii]